MADSVALLNETSEDEIAKGLISMVKEKRDVAAKALTETFMEPPQYAQVFGAHRDLAQLLYEMTEYYNRKTRI